VKRCYVSFIEHTISVPAFFYSTDTKILRRAREMLVLSLP
jgi:hypothetical protein